MVHTTSTASHLQSSIARHKAILNAHKNGQQATSETKAYYTKLASHSNEERAYWRTKLSNGCYHLYNMKNGKEIVALRKDVKSQRPVIGSLEMQGETYMLRSVEGQPPYYYK